ncbi:hypothetical protein EH223_15355 [candidate division KSB1 bacterium]|nr:hypothetical protein [candidate division KSB1 bacterium]RQW01292.1 MAG: hypothetical protein EH223_15355 [candidate division KSB1 bacterium]
MKIMCSILLFSILVISCGERRVPEGQTVGAGLQKISNLTDSQIQELRDSGAEIIVQETDYVVVRTTKMTKPMAFSATPIEEQDLVQRLIHVYVPDSTALQTVINSGVDFWQVDGDTAIARAFDLYIRDLQNTGLTVRIVAQDASQWLKGRK